MRIIIHGANNGYDGLIPKLNIGELHEEGLFEVRPVSNKVTAIGGEAYSIHFSNKNCVVFSKYKIIRDVLRDRATGNVAFSIIISNKEKLAGNNVKALLDELAQEFTKIYNIKDNNLEIKVCDCDNSNFFAEFEKRYKLESNKNYNINIANGFKQGIKEAAFVYYFSDDELLKYFDTPYQREYIEYKQVFFVKNDDPKNPLDALQHSKDNNLTPTGKKILAKNNMAENKITEIDSKEKIETPYESMFSKSAEINDFNDEDDIQLNVNNSNIGKKYNDKDATSDSSGRDSDNDIKDEVQSCEDETEDDKPQKWYIKHLKYVFIIAILLFTNTMTFILTRYLNLGQQIRTEKIKEETTLRVKNDSSLVKEITDTDIKNYVEGVELDSTKLAEYKELWEGKKENTDEWFDIDRSINKAINIRDLINDRNIERLQVLTTAYYSEQQNFFCIVIKNIDPKHLEKVKGQLGDVSGLTLTKIADKITEICREQETIRQPAPQAAPKTTPQAAPKTTPQAAPSNSDSDKILAYLKGKDLHKDTLRVYREMAKTESLKASIDLCLEFWKLDHNNGDSYWAFNEKVKINKNLKNSALQNFLTEACLDLNSNKLQYTDSFKRKGLQGRAFQQPTGGK